MLIKKSILEMRSEEVQNADIKSKKYHKLLKLSSEIENQIQALIPADKQDEYYKLSNRSFDAYAKINAIEIDKAYRQGFYDGLEIAKRLICKNIR